MGLTSAEKQKRYRERINADPAKREEYLRKMRERARRRRDLKIDKLINDLSERGKRQRRKEWRDRKRKSRENIKQQRRPQEAILSQTPPSTPDYQCLQEEHANTRRGRKKLRKDRTASYRRIKQLEEALKQANKKINKYRKKVHRLKATNKTPISKVEDSPVAKLKADLEDHKNIPATVKRKLLFQEALLQEVRKTYKDTKDEKTKQRIASICTGGNIKKYKFVRRAKETLGIWATSRDEKYIRTRRLKLYSKIRKFYCRDDSSMQTPGKKQVITYRGVRKQKRLLSENLRTLHEKFKKEFEISVSFATFCKFRPFWVVRAKLTDRDSCLCKKHDNLQKKLDTLLKEKLIVVRNLESVCNMVCCSTESLLCMTNKCKQCKDKKAIDTVEIPEFDNNKMVRWKEWKTVKQEIEKDGKKNQVSKATLSEETGKLSNLIFNFNKEIKQVFCQHVFRIRHQFNQSHKCKNELCYHEAVIHMDFSENYSCKLSSEIQAMHFGASKEQATLHTIVVYFESGEKKMFCTVSDSRRHDASAIWAHLNPILKELRERKIDTVHFFSDGPFSQYKNKENIYFFKTYFHEMGFQYGTWNFSEASHGKGAPDGIGGAIKRLSDNLVSRGIDIKNAKVLFEQVKDKTSVKMYFIQTDEIEKMDLQKSQISIKKIPGIANTHQIISRENENHIYKRDYSCFCKKLPVIDKQCYNLNKFSLIDDCIKKNWRK